ncbi:putative RNA-binding protein [Encephalitozoon hellem]|nr:putative RNA-binding protein [Encephalitozoon hellem]
MEKKEGDKHGLKYKDKRKRHCKNVNDGNTESEGAEGKITGKRAAKEDDSTNKKKRRLQKIEFDEATCSVVVKGTSTLKDIKRTFKNFKAVKSGENGFILEYPSREHALVDMKANRRQEREGGERSSRYLDNKYILTNLSYKEDKESISKVFEKYGEIERITIKKNKDNISTGKAIITFKKKAVIKEEIVMNNKPIYIERVKKPLENKTRFFLGKITKSLSIVDIRKILAEARCKPKDIRILYGENKRNRGYGFIEYANEEDANMFAKKFEKIKELLGPESYYEYSNEKAFSKRK